MGRISALLLWHLSTSLSGYSGRGVWASPHKSPLQTFDYVIVGGGNAGLTVASRLSEDPDVSVAVLEAGTFYEDVTGNQSQVPANDFYYNGKDPEDTNPLVEWGFTTTPQAGIDNEVVHYTRGKTLGGCTALNYMAYQHAPSGALQQWADELDDQSFAYPDVSEFYQKSLNFTPPDQTIRIANATPSYDESDLGVGGPLDVGYPNYAQAIGTWFALGMEDVGIAPLEGGFTSGELIGSSYLMSTINHTTGFRESSSTAFLQPVLDRPNLSLFDNTMAEKISFQGDTAQGVEISSGNSTVLIKARKEVIVSAGVFQSPQLLLVSGVGPADLLEDNGIEVVADLPGVGQGMHDHVFFGISYKVNVQTSSHLAYGDAFQRAIEEFQTQQQGFLTSPGGDFGGYEKLPEDIRSGFSEDSLELLAGLPDDWPEIQYLSLPAYVGDFQTASVPTPPDGHQYATLLATLNAPFSRGNVSISSASMNDQPLINPNWLSAEVDVELAIGAFKRLRQIFESPALANFTIGEEYFPGAEVSTDEEIHENIKRTFNTMYHASSTCKMGTADDEGAVVDSTGLVYGVKNLRVVDASIFPLLPPGLPMGTVYMLAEKISDAIKQGW